VFESEFLPLFFFFILHHCWLMTANYTQMIWCCSG